MKENIAYLAKLTAYFVWNVVKLYFIVLISIILTLSLFFTFISSDIDSLSFSSKMVYLFTKKAYLSVPFILTIIGSIYIIYTKSVGYAISKTIKKLLKEKSDGIIAPYLDKALDLIGKSSSDFFQSKESFINSKSAITNSIESLNSNRVTKIALKYILQKINLDDVAFSSENTPFKTILQSKIMSKIHELAQPSSRIFWLIIGLQWLFVIIAYYLK